VQLQLHHNQNHVFFAQVRDREALRQRMEMALADFNGRSRKPMNLVMFMFAVEHVSR
jgi:dynein heavy chain, axonemal